METEHIDEVDEVIEENNGIKWCSYAQKLLKEDKLHPIPTSSKSKVWEAFRILNGNDSICIICASHIKYDKSYITTFRYHLNKVHNLNLDVEPQTNKKRQMNDYFERVNQNEAENIVFRWLTNHNIPTTVLEHEELRELLKLSNHRLPNRKAYNKYLHINSCVAKEKIKFLMKDSMVSLTSDGWKSNSNTSFLGITSRVVTNEFEIYNIWACLKQINQSTSENIKNQFEEFQVEYGIVNIESITTDGAPNMTCAARQFLMKEGNRCYCHNCKIKI